MIRDRRGSLVALKAHAWTERAAAALLAPRPKRLQGDVEHVQILRAAPRRTHRFDDQALPLGLGDRAQEDVIPVVLLSGKLHRGDHHVDEPAVHLEMDVRWSDPASRDRIRARLDGLERILAVGVRGGFAEPQKVRILRGGIGIGDVDIPTFRIGLPDLHHCALDPPALFVDDASGDLNDLAVRLSRRARDDGQVAVVDHRPCTVEPVQVKWFLVLPGRLPALLSECQAADGAPAGQIGWPLPFTLAATLFEPAEAPGPIAPFMMLYALHDALVKRLPERAMAPSLAESWSTSHDGLVYEFVLRKAATFHNGEPVTAEDVKFSFERYRGISARVLKEKVAAVETPDPRRVRFRLKQPWPDFMAFYGTPATGAAWIVPRKYVERVGEDGFRKAPVGAGPYKFVSFTPGVELVLEAFEGYWRKTPSVKRLVFKVVPDAVTRLAMLKRGEVDIAYAVTGELGEEVRRTPGLTLRPTPFVATHWLVFADQWDPSSPWHDRRVRLAANHAVDRQTINQAVTLGFSKITGSIIPTSFEFYWQPPLYPYDPGKARQLLAEARDPKGFDAGDFWGDAGARVDAAPGLNDLHVVR